jgi:AcrR family transcriptional regulator
MFDEPKLLSTAQQRRETVLTSAIAVFAKTGFLGTPITAVARHAGISSAYVFKLFPSKEGLFASALDRCFEIIVKAMTDGADKSADQTPTGVLSAMGLAYAALIADRDLLTLQVHAQSAASVPEIGASFRAGIEKVTTYVKARSGAPDADVQRFMANGLLCALITILSLEDDSAAWAHILTEGFSHPR